MTSPPLAFDSSHGRMYAHPNRANPVPSITNIIGKKDKPGLKYWAMRECAAYVSENVATLARMDKGAISDVVRTAPFRQSGKASGTGDIVHDAIDEYVKGTLDRSRIGLMEATEQNMMRQFFGFCARYEPVFTDSEFTVWSDKHGYAGTGDFACTIGGLSVLGDTKTGKKVYPEVGMQLAAVANADVIVSADGTERPLPVFDKYAVLHIRPMFSKLIPVDRVDDCFTAFLGLRAVFRFDSDVADEVLRYAPKIETRAGQI